MDPDAALDVIRDCLRIVHNPDTSPEDQHDYLQELAGRVEALDEWLTRGGFLPADWAKHAKLHPNER